MDVQVIVIVTIAAALIFDVINGFHDAANSIATIVSTRVLSPRIAVLWAAVFNFIALFVFHQGVANTIAKTVEIKAADPAFVWVVMCGLTGAILWNLLTWWWGLPSSSSHALIGGMIGAALPAVGVAGLVLSGIGKIALFIVFSPLIGMVLGTFMMILSTWAVRKSTPMRVDKWFRRLQ